VDKGQFKEAIAARQRELRANIGALKDHRDSLEMLDEEAQKNILVLRDGILNASKNGKEHEVSDSLDEALIHAQAQKATIDAQLKEVNRRYDLIKGSMAENDYWYSSSFLND
jgi:septal ring factor EnvC (AmiA/AmiB activator)